MRNILIHIMMSAVLTAQPASQPNAWGETSWGMTEVELTATFGPQLLHRDHKFVNPTQLSTLAVEGLDIAGDKWEAHLILDTAGKLEAVRLMPTDGRMIDEAMFHRAETALAEKYGSPFSRSADGQHTSQWKTAATLIQLTYYQPKAIPLRTLHLTYTPKKTSPDL